MVRAVPQPTSESASSHDKGAIFERLYRDSAASLFQPLNEDQTRTYIGQFLLNAAAEQS